MSQLTKVVGAVAAGTVALGAAGVAIGAGGSSRSSGPQFTYTSPSPFADAAADVHVVAKGSGSTRVSLQVRGVDAPAGTTFGAHVHTSPCGATGGAAGPHYQHAGATGSLEDREVWLDVTVNASGNALAQATRPWQIDESTPRSVIIHAQATNPDDGTAGARLACIDIDGD
jgi:Cu-Zn family superoxide dismutase